MRHPRRRDRAHELETVQAGADAVEQPFASTQQRGYEMDLHLVDQARSEVLLHRLRTAGKRYVLAACGAPSLFERRV